MFERIFAESAFESFFERNLFEKCIESRRFPRFYLMTDKAENRLRVVAGNDSEQFSTSSDRIGLSMSRVQNRVGCFGKQFSFKTRLVRTPISSC